MILLLIDLLNLVVLKQHRFLSGSDRNPFTDIILPRYLTYFVKNLHFLILCENFTHVVF